MKLICLIRGHRWQITPKWQADVCRVCRKFDPWAC